MKKNILQEKSYQFALNSVKVEYDLIGRKEYIISKQFIRSATSIGANVEEAIGSYTKKEFHHKISIYYKEARETKFWIRLLRDSGWLEKEKSNELLVEIEEMLKIIGATLKTLKNAKTN